MNKKVNFSALEIEAVDGQKQTVDVQDELANLIYMHGQNIQECELGKRLWLAGKDENGQVVADRSVNLQPHDAGTIERMAGMFPFVIRHAIVQEVS